MLNPREAEQITEKSSIIRQMSIGRRLTPLLAAILVIQGVVGMAPHDHDPTTVVIGSGAGLKAQSSIDSSHGCLACSVHAPVIEQTSVDQDAPIASVSGRFRAIGETLHAERTDGPPSPRGPPLV
jgi:hypothetical protein